MEKLDPQTVAEAVAGQCLAGRVRRLNRVVTNIYDRALAPYGLKVNQASILVALLILGEASPREIGARLQMEKSTVSRTLDRMKGNGWIEIEGAGPGQTVRISEAGKKLLVASHDAWRQAQERACTLLGEDGATALAMIAERLKTAE